MSTEREELTELILSNFHPGATSGSSWRLNPIKAADDVIAAGYRKQSVIDPKDLKITNGWLVAPTGGCTCAYGEPYYHHESGCGYEPIVNLSEVLEREGYVEQK